MSPRIIAQLPLAGAFAPICLAQTDADVDRISNWPAPLYWQAPARSARGAAHGPGRSREAEVATENAAASTLGVPAVFVAMTPCRLVDTRDSARAAPFGTPAFNAGEIRTLPLPESTDCTVPANAVAYSLNIAVVPLGTAMRWLTAWNTGAAQPSSSTLNDKAGLVTSNSAVIPAGTCAAGGCIDVFVTDATNVIIDINGYYAPPNAIPLTGIATAPALTFGDNTTGLYSDTAGTVKISTAGQNRVTVRPDGDLEITGRIWNSGRLFAHGTWAVGGGNTGIGLSALSSASPGTDNTGVGTNALGVTTGTDNAAVGSNALAANTTGTNNTAVGSHSLAPFCSRRPATRIRQSGLMH